MVSLVFIALILSLCALVSADTNASNGVEGKKYSRGAIATLIKGSKKSDFADLITRNKSILKHLYLPLYDFKNKTRNSLRMQNLDIILFYEEATSAKIRKYIQAKTPDLPLKFIPVQFNGHIQYEDSFNVTAKLVYPNCPPNPTANIFKLNYRNMCRFWFIGFLDYVKEYDWLWRLDSDCEVLGNVRQVIPIDYSHLTPGKEDDTPAAKLESSRPKGPSLGGNIDVDLILDGRGEFRDANEVRGEEVLVDYSGVFVSSPSWTPLDQQYYDEISPKIEGVVVSGLGRFTRDFASRHGLLDPADPSSFIDSMYSPYTNSVLFNLKWLRGESWINGVQGSGGGESHSAVLRQFLREVDESNCIYSNRWGDMPMIGAMLSLVRQPVHFLSAPYYHESHKVLIDSQAETGITQATFGDMYLAVFGDNSNPSDLNTRITYHEA